MRSCWRFRLLPSFFLGPPGLPTRFRPSSMRRYRSRFVLVQMDSSTLRRVFKAFQYRDFRLMWIGACTSSIGTFMQIVAQSWLIYSLTNSKFLLALNEVLGGLPIFLFSLVGGAIADRMDRRRVLLGSQYVQMSCAFVCTILVATGTVRVWHLLTLSTIAGF